MITSSSTVIASSLAVMVEENRDSLEPGGRRGKCESGGEKLGAEGEKLGA